MADEQSEWFAAWFDSPYYHLLYRHRDRKEAALFLDRLLHLLQPLPGSKILDLACGRGRHAVYLNKRGFIVTGTDLSPTSIAHASQWENSTLQFLVADMREPLKGASFDLILNLFTSFGYFKNEEEHQRAVHAMAAQLRPDGTLVLDYLNSELVRKQFIPSETVDVQKIAFHIHRKVEGNCLVKSIRFTDRNHQYAFEERVMLFGSQDFQRFFRRASLQITGMYGDYALNPFRPETSPRLILIAKHKP